MAATAGDAAACPAYPWPRDGAQRGGKVFMQSDCTACHGPGMFSHAGLSDDAVAQAVTWEPKAAEIVVMEEVQVQPAATLHGGAYPPDLTLITKIPQGLRGNLYAGGGTTEAPRMLTNAAAAVCEELKKRALPCSVCL